ncbi:hypothetical protein [Mesorhizobium sp. M0296]|uniref:hypothetical protein n=1 Tax=Mesorhizobium sp. M0296 TaxID=2956931 RepID=UPI00333B749E
MRATIDGYERPERSRVKYEFRYDDPNPASLLAFLVEGFRRANEMVAPSPWGPPIEIDPAYPTAIRNMLTDVNSFKAAIDGAFRTRAAEMVAATGVKASGGQALVEDLVRGWRYEQLVCDLLAKERVVSQSKVFSPAARVIAAICEMLRAELGVIKDTPLYGEVANLLNRGIPKSETGLKGRHIRAGANRWRGDLLIAVKTRRRDCISAKELVEMEHSYITGTVRGLLILWQQAPLVERFKKSGRGADLARAIDDQDCISYRIGKTDGHPLNLRALYDFRR